MEAEDEFTLPQDDELVSDQEIEAAGSEDGDSSYIEDEDELQNESTRRHDPVEDEESLSLDDE